MPGSVNPGSVRQSDPVLRNQQEGESLLQEEGRRRQAEAGDPDHLLRSNVTQAAASASANNSPFRSARNSPEPRPAGESEDVETQPPQMSTPDLTAFTASLQVAHNAAEAQRVETAKLREELAAEKTKTMEAIIGRLEAEKVAIEAANTALQVTADAAKADAAKARQPG